MASPPVVPIVSQRFIIIPQWMRGQRQRHQTDGKGKDEDEEVEYKINLFPGIEDMEKIIQMQVARQIYCKNA